MEEIKKGLCFGALGAGLASLCCITPLVIVMFGLSSISFALSLTKYKPFFLAVGALFVLLAIFLNVRKKGTVCSIDPNEIKRKKYFIAAVFIAMLLLYALMQYVVLPYLGQVVYS